MNKTGTVAENRINQLEGFCDLIIDAIQDIKAKDIIKLDLRKLYDRPADVFIVCQGESVVQVRAIAENVRGRIKKELGILPGHYEGKAGAKWVLVDYFDVIVHIFYPETREYYNLEDLWSDADITEYQDL